MSKQGERRSGGSRGEELLPSQPSTMPNALCIDALSSDAGLNLIKHTAINEELLINCLPTT